MMKRFISLLLILLAPLAVFADDTGWQYCTSADQFDYNGGTAWSTLTNLYTDNSQYATNLGTGADYYDYVRGYFTLSSLVPAGATINGIEVRYRAKRSGSGPAEDSLKIVIGGTAVGTDGSLQTAIPGSNTDFTRGGATSLWGLTPTRDEVVGATFGFQVAFIDDDPGGDTISVDSLSIKIYFTPAASGPTAAEASRGFFGF